MDERGQESGAVKVLLVLIIVGLVLSVTSIAMVSGIAVPKDIATKEEIDELKLKISDLNYVISGLESDLDEIKELLGAAPTGEVVVESLEVPWCRAGEPSSIEVVFRNPGAEEGTGKFPLRVAGEIVETLEPTISGYATESVLVDVTKDEGGNYPVSISTKSDILVVMNSPPDEYESAALSYAEEIIGRGYTPLTEDEEKKELLWFAHAAEPYRGTMLHTISEALPYSTAEIEYTVPMFEDITGISVEMRITSSFETTTAFMAEIETQMGAFDFFSVDTDENPILGRRGGFEDLTEYMGKHPEITDPWFDLADFVRGSFCTDYHNGHWLGIPMSTGAGGFIYRMDWIRDEEEKAAFEAEYGYELKEPGDWDRMEWTWEKALDYMEFFTRPDEGKYGFIGWGKTTPELTWILHVNDATAGGASQFVEWPEVPIGPERDEESIKRGECLWVHRPYVMHLQVGYVGNDPVGALVEHGGNTNGEANQELFEYYSESMHKYAPDIAMELLPPESEIVEYMKGYIFTTGSTWAGLFPGAYSAPDSPIKGKWWMGPCPLNMDYNPDGDGNAKWHEGMPTQKDDLSQWSISMGSKNKEAAWLYVQFAQSKAISADKQVVRYLGAPLRKSTWESLKSLPKAEYDEINTDWGGLLDYGFSYDFWAQSCTDPALFDPAGYYEALYSPLAKGLREGWSGEKTMTMVAEALEDLLEELGIMRPDLRDQIEREEWRP